MLRVAIALVALVGLTGCERRSGEAIVVTKEHIAAAPVTAEKPRVEDGSNPINVEEETRPMHDDEITVDGYVMKSEIRGTSRDPRASKDEQWLIKVRMISDGRTFNVPADQSQFGNLKDGDRVQVSYRVGKYTKTVWGAGIETK